MSISRWQSGLISLALIAALVVQLSPSAAGAAAVSLAMPFIEKAVHALAGANGNADSPSRSKAPGKAPPLEPLITSQPPADNVVTRTSAAAAADQDSDVASASGKINLRLPRGALASPAQVAIAEHSRRDSTGMRIINLFELNATDVATRAKITSFAKPLQITIKHREEELAGIDRDSLRLYYLDETRRQWLPVADSKYDAKTGLQAFM